MNRLDYRPVRITTIVIAGLVSGLVEVLWIGISASILGADAANVAREIAVSVLPVTASANATPWLGLGVHFILSISLAAAFGVVTTAWWRAGAGKMLAVTLVSFAVVWALNFLIVLPWLNPVFTTLLPAGVTLVSKLFFGFALWGVFAKLDWSQRQTARVEASSSLQLS